ncbi:MAG: cytochrome c oxidase assembly factor Coa1 family protein [Thermoguttaceae bacterium]
MNTDISDAVAVKVAKVAARKRGWFKRHWLWFLPTLVVLIAALGAGVAYWSLFVSIYRLDVVQAAMKTIKADKTLQEKLGAPLHKVWWPSREAIPNARIEEREKDVLWNIHGTKGVAKAHVLAQMRLGQWQTVLLEVTLADGKKISLGGGGDKADDAPVYQAPKPKPGDKSSERNAPPPNVDLKIPE